MGTLLLFSLSRSVYILMCVFITGLLSSLGVRGSCWLVSVVSESCSDTATDHKHNQVINHSSSHLSLHVLIMLL